MAVGNFFINSTFLENVIWRILLFGNLYETRYKSYADE